MSKKQKKKNKKNANPLNMSKKKLTKKEIYIHPSSVVDSNVKIGRGTKIWHFCHIQSGARIGEGCSFGQNVNVSNNVSIGSGVKVQNNVSIYEGVELGDNVFCGPSCVFTNDLTPRAGFHKGHENYKKTIVEDNASIGANATIVCGHRVGHDALIGAGAVVASDVPPHALMLGVPAKQHGWVCWCGERLKPYPDSHTDEYHCPSCGTTYHETPEGIERYPEV